MTGRRKNTIYIILGLLLISELAALFWNSAVVEGVSSRADYLKSYAVAERNSATILPGDILDRNGVAIAETSIDQETGKRVTHYLDGTAFSQVIGYTGAQKTDFYADSEYEIAGARREYRLMKFLNSDYWGENGLYSVSDPDSRKGQNVKLTLDADLQMEVAEILKGIMDPEKSIGSAVVMDAKTGEILADVSFPTYDFNDLDTAITKMYEDEKNTILEPAAPVTSKNPESPGSIFKVLVAASLLEHNMGDFKVINEPFTVAGCWTCEPVDYESGTLVVKEGDELDLETALQVSSNTYFAKAALELGADKLQETAERFGLTEGEESLLLDFGTILYNWDLKVSKDILAQTGFGQGKTELTTVYAAMITQAIANDGIMIKPYMVGKMMENSGKTVYEGVSEVLSEATDKETAQLLASYMRTTAEEACSLSQTEEVTEIFDRYHIAGKTGTAEIGDREEHTNAWYVSFAPADDPQYVVVVNQCKDKKHGSDLMPVVARIYENLFEQA